MSPLLSSEFDTLLKNCGFTSENKLEMFTMGRNSILMRVENIGDIYDSNGEVTYGAIKIQALADGLYTLMNNNMIAFTSTVEELSLTGNQNKEAMQEKRIKWKT